MTIRIKKYKNSYVLEDICGYLATVVEANGTYYWIIDSDMVADGYTKPSTALRRAVEDAIEFELDSIEFNCISMLAKEA